MHLDNSSSQNNPIIISDDESDTPSSKKVTVSSTGSPMKTPRKAKTASSSSNVRRAKPGQSMASSGSSTGVTPIKKCLAALNLGSASTAKAKAPAIVSPKQIIYLSSDDECILTATPSKPKCKHTTGFTPEFSSRKRNSVSRPSSPIPSDSPSKVRKIISNASASSLGGYVSDQRVCTSSFATKRRGKPFPRPALKQPLFTSAGSSINHASKMFQVDDVFTRPSQTNTSDTEMGEPSDSEESDLVHSSATTTGSSVSERELSLEEFLFNKSIDLPVEVIAHDLTVQDAFDSLEISWGVQFELARGVSAGLWSWGDVLAKVTELTGTEQESLLKVEHVMLGIKFQVSMSNASLAKQLRLEQDAIMENKDRGLGLMGDYQGESRWYSGKVQQIAHVVEGENDELKVVLQPLTQTKSTRFARYLGSRRIIQLRVSDRLALHDKYKEQISDVISHKFVLCGRVFVPWVAKEGSVYMVECEENYERESQTWCGDHLRKSYASILEWHNPSSLNSSQPLAKYVTRNVLGLSTSAPGLLFEDCNMVYIDDEVSTDYNGDMKKVPSDKLMTDGCGFLNREAFKRITFELGLEHQPSAIQARIAGNKGLWIIHPSDTNTEPKIWIRHSQHKINHPRPYHRSLRILDVVSIGNPPSSVSLSTQSILNLSFNGIGVDVLTKLMEDGIRQLIEPLAKDISGHPMGATALWDAVARAGGVTGSRAHRFQAGLGRVLGLARREWNSSVVYHDTEKSDTGETDAGASTGRKPYTGEPYALAEVIIELIQAGFIPSQSSYLHSKLEYFIQAAIQGSMERYQIPLPEGTSREAFVVPDPQPRGKRTLKKGQVFFCSSLPMADPTTKQAVYVPKGHAIMGRFPLRLPSDIQKVEVVDIPELHEYKDVIVVNTEGSKSLMNLLSGGDFDGDTAFLIWLDELVTPFQSRPLYKAPDNFLKMNFHRSIESVVEFNMRIRKKKSATAQREFVKVQLAGFSNGRVGLYSTFHDYAVWKFGLDSPHAVLLAYMFNTVLDSGKTGYVLLEAKFNEHRSMYGMNPPRCFSSKGDEKRSPMGPFILEMLQDFGYALGNSMLAAYKNQRVLSEMDRDIQAIWRGFVDRTVIPTNASSFEADFANRLQEELLAIRKHVKLAHIEYCRSSKLSAASSPVKDHPKNRRKGKQTTDIMAKAIKMFWSDVPDLIIVSQNDAVLLKAACAYCVLKSDSELGCDKLTDDKSKFAFTVAFDTLRHIKVKASGPYATSILQIDEMRGVTSAARKVIDSLQVLS